MAASSSSGSWPPCTSKCSPHMPGAGFFFARYPAGVPQYCVRRFPFSIRSYSKRRQSSDVSRRRRWPPSRDSSNRRSAERVQLGKLAQLVPVYSSNTTRVIAAYIARHHLRPRHQQHRHRGTTPFSQPPAAVVSQRNNAHQCQTVIDMAIILGIVFARGRESAKQ